MADAVPEGSLAPLVEALLDTQAEAYLKEISANTKRGHALLRGLGYATGGRPPFGLMEAREPMGQRKSGEVRQGVRWVADPLAAPRVAEAFAIKAAGATYVELLRGPLAGVYRTKSALPPFFQRAGYVAGGVISRELFDQVQMLIMRRRRREGPDHPRTLGCSHLLVGMVYCACGARMAADAYDQRWRYFRCAERQRNPTSTCLQGKVPMDTIVEPLLDRIMGAIAAPGEAGALTALANEHVNGDDELQARADRIDHEIAQLDAAIGRLVAAVARGGEAEGLLSALNAKEAERRRMRDDLAVVQHQIATQRRSVLTREEVAAIVDELQRSRERDDVAELRSIVAMVVQRVTITGREYEVTWRPEARAWFTPH
jgi:hypothetical protein